MHCLTPQHVQFGYASHNPAFLCFKRSPCSCSSCRKSAVRSRRRLNWSDDSRCSAAGFVFERPPGSGYRTQRVSAGGALPGAGADHGRRLVSCISTIQSNPNTPSTSPTHLLKSTLALSRSTATRVQIPHLALAGLILTGSNVQESTVPDGPPAVSTGHNQSIRTQHTPLGYRSPRSALSPPPHSGNGAFLSAVASRTITTATSGRLLASTTGQPMQHSPRPPAINNTMHGE